MRQTLLLLLSATLALPQAGGLYEGDLDGRPITFRISDGYAIYQDDIILGPAGKPSGQRNTSFFTGNLWPDGLVPYEIDPLVPTATQNQIQQAINTWNAYGTPIRLQPRSGETDFARFTRPAAPTGVCSSFVGRRGGSQAVSLDDGCTAPTIIHEIGHAIGMWHEQSRIDRNLNVTILFENIAKDRLNNYVIEGAGQDIGGYEYSSSMQYRPFSFSVDGKQTIESVPPGIPMGEAPGMNAGDLDAVSRKYGRVLEQTTIVTNPPGLTVLVDGVPVVTPRAFSWAAGSPHTIGVAADPQVLGTLQYAFGKWSDGGAQVHSVEGNPAVTVYTANFIRRVPVVLTQNSGGTASASPASPDGFYPAYTQVQLTAVPDDGFRFYRWTSNSSFFCTGTTSANPLTLPPRTSGYGCAPLFTQGAMTAIDSDPPGQPVVVDGVSYTAPVNFLFAPGTSHTLGASTPNAGFSTSRFIFSGWSDGGPPVHPYTALPDGGTVTARFTKQYRLLPTQPSTLVGRIQETPSSTDGFYDAGTVVTLQANLNSPFSLFSWTGDLVGNSNPTTIVMDDQRLVGISTTVSNPPFIVLNALTFRAASIAPGQLVSLFGSDLGPEGGAGPVIDASGRVATESGGTKVSFDGIPAPILYTSPGQVNVVVPYGVAGTVTRILAEYRGVSKPVVSVPLIPVNPSIVSNGAGKAVVVNEDGSINTPARPARRGSVIVFFASGEGQTSPAGVDGRVGVAPLARPAQAVSVRVGGKVAELLYAGNAPNFVAGAMQVNARIPADAPTGDVSLYLMVGTASSPAITKISVAP